MLLVVVEAAEVAAVPGELTEHILVSFIARQRIHKLQRHTHTHTSEITIVPSKQHVDVSPTHSTIHLYIHTYMYNIGTYTRIIGDGRLNSRRGSEEP